MNPILLASYYAHLSAAKELAMIYPIDNVRRVEIERSIGELVIKLNLK